MAEGHSASFNTTDDSLPDLPRCKLTQQQVLSKSRPHTLSAPGVGVFDGKSPGSSRCSSPRLRRSLDLIRISRNEWEQRERSLATLRADKNELNSVFRQHSDLEKRLQQLQKACLQLTHTLGCTSITEISGEVITSVIHPMIVQMITDCDTAKKQVTSTNDELSKVQGSLSSTATKLSTSEAQTIQLRTAINSKDTEIQQLKNELERLRQSESRSRSMLQSMEGQVKLLEGKRKSEDSTQCVQLNEIVIFKKQLKDKENEIALAKDQINTLQVEKDELQERTIVSDAAYEELCLQLSDALQMDPSESYDYEKMLAKVQDLMTDCNDYKIKIESLNKLSEVAELDSKANRETIVRLAADVKRHEEQSIESTDLLKKLNTLKKELEKVEKEKINLSERLAVAQGTITSLQQVVKAKENSIEEIKQVLEVTRQQNRRDEMDSQLEPYRELCKRLKSVLKCSSDEMIVPFLNHLIKEKQDFELRVIESERVNRETLHKLSQTAEQLKDTEEDLVTERSKLADMSRNVELCEILRNKVQELQNKHEVFLKRLLQLLKVESGSGVLVGDFAEDAAFVRIEQLSKHESQAMVDKQTAFYSAQRKLKSCRQQLEAKELQLELSQRKILALESRLSEVTQKEMEWNATIDKSKRVDKQIERLQEKVMKQQEMIVHLKADSECFHRLKDEEQLRDDKMAKLESQVESLQQNKINLSQSLAEARLKVQTIASQDKERADKAEQLLQEKTEELELANECKDELSEFKSEVKKLIATVQYDQESDTGQQDQETLSQIEKLIFSCNKYKELSTSLQASLRQLEMGFKRGYQDTLTLLNTT